MTYLAVALGGAIGSVARFGVAQWVTARFGVPGNFPQVFALGTLLINVSGSFLIGFLAAVLTAAEGGAASPHFRAFLMTGICGGYTTFSSFSLQTMELAKLGHVAQAGTNCLLSLVLCLAAVWLGHAAGMMLQSK
ncbi:camphor resistance protein CrcB [Verrucomicrobium sp. GAS474]|uniref:fluoride efflux transporter CrcB n=1 Tax=Verrucomicrobium sp. GAS474 TaxID=1882831 RepID=UPI0008793589|nr:camphor resistance protein CrcB [Verrucomicrobium sp. GAS474]